MPTILPFGSELVRARNTTFVSLVKIKKQVLVSRPPATLWPEPSSQGQYYCLKILLGVLFG
eukprot:4637517-Amphidinium_carterae.1